MRVYLVKENIKDPPYLSRAKVGEYICLSGNRQRYFERVNEGRIEIIGDFPGSSMPSKILERKQLEHIIQMRELKERERYYTIKAIMDRMGIDPLLPQDTES